jgi:7,8-dihydropterin-6-yl-methyl-4-(beta-D-ribofuranosyl)aminobenzene 5'-phosphate synthase
MQTLRVLDALQVDVLLDNATDGWISKPHHVGSEFINVTEAGVKELSGPNLCCAQLGLSLMLTAHAEGRRRKLLFDAGPEGAIFLRNCKNLGVALDDVEAIAISHGHWDHMGALLSAIGAITRNGQRRVACHVNPGMFVERGARLPNGHIVAFEKVPSPDAITLHGADVVNNGESRFLLDNCFYLSGEIPRVSSFEKGRPDHLSRVDANTPWQSDPLLLDERYVAVHVRGKGLFVFTSCSHAGVVNVLHDLRQSFPDDPIYGVVGGLHLVGEASEKIIPDTMGALKEFNLKEVVPAHCTGWKALHALLNTFGETAIVPSVVGNRYQY